MTSNMKTSTTSVPLSHASNILVDVDDATIIIGNETIIDDVSFCIHKGEFIGLIGPNGAGKTTLLKAVLGLREPSSGSIKRSHNSVVGYIPQRGVLYSGNVPISVLEVVKLGTTNGTKAGALEALRLVGMQDAAHKAFTELSGGQQQRVSIAKAVAGNASLLILDEPTTGIDEQAQSAFYALLRELQMKGITIVMVSHEVETVLSLVTRVICLNRSIVYDGPPEHFEADKYLPASHNQQHIRLHHHHEGTAHA